MPIIRNSIWMSSGNYWEVAVRGVPVGYLPCSDLCSIISDTIHVYIDTQCTDYVLSCCIQLVSV